MPKGVVFVGHYLLRDIKVWVTRVCAINDGRGQAQSIIVYSRIALMTYVKYSLHDFEIANHKANSALFTIRLWSCCVM